MATAHVRARGGGHKSVINSPNNVRTSGGQPHLNTFGFLPQVLLEALLKQIAKVKRHDANEVVIALCAWRGGDW